MVEGHTLTYISLLKKKTTPLRRNLTLETPNIHFKSQRGAFKINNWEPL